MGVRENDFAWTLHGLLHGATCRPLLAICRLAFLLVKAVLCTTSVGALETALDACRASLLAFLNSTRWAPYSRQRTTCSFCSRQHRLLWSTVASLERHAHEPVMVLGKAPIGSTHHARNGPWLERSLHASHRSACDLSEYEPAIKIRNRRIRGRLRLNLPQFA